MADFDQAFTRVLGSEGGYSDRAADRGGPTRWGVTEKLARAKGYQGDMKDYPLDDAKAVYRAEFWDLLKLSDVEDQKEAEDLFQIAANSGPGFERTVLAHADGVAPHMAQIFVQQMAHYAAICDHDHTQIANLHGWLNRALSYTV